MVHSPVCRLLSKTTSACEVCKRRVDPEFSAITIRLTTPLSLSVSHRQAQWSSARRTATSLRWARRMKTPLLDQYEIPGTRLAFRAARRVDQRPPSQRGSFQSHLVQTRAALFVNPRPSSASSD